MNDSSFKVVDGEIVLSTTITDVIEANLLRRSFLGSVPGLAVELVSFDDNDTARHDELLAHRLGLMPIKYDENENGKEYTFFFEGWTKDGQHRRITCDDMDSIDFVYQNSTLTYLRKDERLSFTVKLGIGLPGTHAKFSSVATVGMKEVDGHFTFAIRSIGTHEDEDLVKYGFEGMELAALSGHESKFFKLRIPETYK